MTTTAVETAMAYIFTVTEGTESFEFVWGKQLPESQTAQEYLQSCKREAELLAAHEIEQRKPPQSLEI